MIPSSFPTDPASTLWRHRTRTRFSAFRQVFDIIRDRAPRQRPTRGNKDFRSSLKLLNFTWTGQPSHVDKALQRRSSSRVASQNTFALSHRRSRLSPLKVESLRRRILDNRCWSRSKKQLLVGSHDRWPPRTHPSTDYHNYRETARDHDDVSASLHQATTTSDEEAKYMKRKDVIGEMFSLPKHLFGPASSLFPLYKRRRFVTKKVSFIEWKFGLPVWLRFTLCVRVSLCFSHLLSSPSSTLLSLSPSRSVLFHSSCLKHLEINLDRCGNPKVSLPDATGIILISISPWDRSFSDLQ